LTTPFEYRERAAAARREADIALTQDLKQSLLRVEAEWLRLASTAEMVLPGDSLLSDTDSERPRPRS
jgi:hypothetical protein